MTAVIIADDHPVVRAGLRAVLANMPNIELVAGHEPRCARLIEAMTPHQLLGQ